MIALALMTALCKVKVIVSCGGDFYDSFQMTYDKLAGSIFGDHCNIFVSCKQQGEIMNNCYPKAYPYDPVACSCTTNYRLAYRASTVVEKVTAKLIIRIKSINARCSKF